MGHFSLSWEAYKQTICSGLGVLQQNGELVDMTLAADGHHVKVHQLVMSLVSPYIKELITSANCPHPIIFLNKISYATLCSILEYIYTGEVLVSKENLSELVEAGVQLRIRGLEDLNVELPTDQQISQAALAISNEGKPLSETGFFKKEEEQNSRRKSVTGFKITRLKKGREKVQDDVDETYLEESHIDDSADDNADYSISTMMETDHDQDTTMEIKLEKRDANKRSIDTSIQYTTSNQGALQMILNRYIYNWRYTARRGEHRTWRCVSYRNAKCPATVITNKEGVVVKRYSAHNHPFDDVKILKKVRDNAVFSAISEAQALGESKKRKAKEIEAASSGK